mmetsp:Transcript_6648/g.7413  ORF Transcript_6648/g.7413 Transcript_6648/m.7413 type:complete len:132 (-) Transcript_6648:253-648(-)
MKGIDLHGKDWKKVQQLVGTRTSAQSRSHAQKVLPKTMNCIETEGIFATPKSPVKEKEINISRIELPLSTKNTKSEYNDKGDNFRMNISEPKINNRKRDPVEEVNRFKDLPSTYKRKCTIDVSSLNPVDEL